MKVFQILSGIVAWHTALSKIYTGNGSYNSFRQQVGFCKMQGFHTVSRQTSHGPSLFLDGLVDFGVGLNHIQFDHNVSNCGRCIFIHDARGMFALHHELDAWNETKNATFPYTAMVFDECKDPICQDGYLDIDIYNLRQPVPRGNPSHFHWEFIDCPRADHIEFLFCFSNTCKHDDPDYRTVAQVLKNASIYHWEIIVRNTVTPIWDVEIQPYRQHLINREGWVWDHGPFHFQKPFSLVLNKNKTLTYAFDFHSLQTQHTTPSYNGGILISHVQK